MKYGYCNLSLIAVRSSADHCAEIITQLLFGESFDIIDTSDNWAFINTHYENYQGWIHSLQYKSLDSVQFVDYQNSHKVLSVNSSSSLKELVSGKYIHLLLGSSFPIPNNAVFNIGDVQYILNGDYFEPLTIKTDIIKFASYYLNAPYLWGGRTQFGVDCSGFTQMIYKLVNVFLPRDASQQAEIGETFSFLSEAEAGDLVFFDNENEKITHVGILFDQNHVIHASGCVRIDKIDHHGIFNEESGKYTHKLRLIKSVFK